MSNCAAVSVINYERNWCIRFKFVEEDCIEVSLELILFRMFDSFHPSFLRSIIYYFTTTVCAVILGIILVSVIRPGEGHQTTIKGDQKVTRDVLTADTLLDLVR